MENISIYSDIIDKKWKIYALFFHLLQKYTNRMENSKFHQCSTGFQT